MSTPTTRITTVADVPALVALRTAWHAERGTPVTDDGFAERFAAWYVEQSRQRVIWLAERDGEPIGTVGLLVYRRMPWPGRDARDWGYLGNAFVPAEHRGAGVGRLLLDALLDHATHLDLYAVLLSPSERSVPFYRRAGFRPTDKHMIRYLDA